MIDLPVRFKPISYFSIVARSDEESNLIKALTTSVSNLASDILLQGYIGEQLSQRFDNFHDGLVLCYDTLASPRSRMAKSQSWWTAECQNAMMQHRNENVSQRRNSPTGRRLQAAIRAAKRAHFDGIIKRLEETKRPWDTLSWIGARQQPRQVSPITNPDGSPMSPSE